MYPPFSEFAAIAVVDESIEMPTSGSATDASRLPASTWL
jgi:hypothetical protein